MKRRLVGLIVSWPVQAYRAKLHSSLLNKTASDYSRLLVCKGQFPLLLSCSKPAKIVSSRLPTVVKNGFPASHTVFCSQLVVDLASDLLDLMEYDPSCAEIIAYVCIACTSRLPFRRGNSEEYFCLCPAVLDRNISHVGPSRLATYKQLLHFTEFEFNFLVQ